jgi:uncharacterized membrane protein
MSKVFVVSFVLSLILFLFLDFVWFFSFSLKHVYKPQFLQINNAPFIGKKMWIGGLSWFILAFTSALFVTTFYEDYSLSKIFCIGLYIGFAIYSVYNFTNYATINNYKIQTVTIDTMWGSILFGTVSLITACFARLV